jgi:hypothetical protein
MSGQIASSAPHLDGSESIGVWFDVAWAAYVHVMLTLDKQALEHIEGVWDDLAAELDENGKPTPETWGASPQAQAGQASLMAMFGGSPDMGDMGTAPGVGDDAQ